jgi:hypothetical protein
MTSMNLPPARLELRQRMYLLSRSQRWALWIAGLLLVMMVLGLAAINIYLVPEDKRIAEELWAALVKKVAAKPLDAAFHLLVLLLAVLQAVYMILAARRERLILTPGGIEYRSPLPAFLQALRPSWSLSWGQMRRASLQTAALVRGPASVTLELAAASRKVKLRPFLWVNPAHYEAPSPWAGFRGQKKATAVENLAGAHESEILRYIAAAAPQLEVKYESKGSEFALEKNRYALAAVVGFFLLMAYAAADTFFLGDEVYAGEPPFAHFIAFGVAAAVLAGTGMRRGGVPALEGVVLALLLGAAVGGAAWPAMLRANAWTDTGGLQRHEYRLTAELSFVPLEAGLPVLAFPRYADYWGSFGTGSIHVFELRYGGLGFYQLNMQPVIEAMRAYYMDKNRRR